ncbi:ankyrin repeat domain-containing protein 10a [Trematomus bernacchii]|uniref:ankyrin repeat domain-containing protein 10a n=1 Tax=Trematomus bernacchii TaxID=40690 RepID=UPI00146DE0E9|nr:ankyrin repeat domain-containing protein 10a [Trematomus bernacchii]
MSGGLQADFSNEEGFISQFPVHRACRDGDVGALVSLFQQLSDPAPLTAEDPCYGWSPLHWAAHYGQLECVVHLVQMGCEVNTVTSRFQQTPTHTAAFGGHPHCLLWLTQAGADVNMQDLVGEAPIHKAARSGSVECIQVLLVAGAKAQLRNASGQTAADLAHAHGFLDSFCFLSKTKKLLQLHVRGGPNGESPPCGPGLLSRKRLLTAGDSRDLKKARGDMLVQMPVGGEDLESVTMESAPELLSAADEHPPAPSSRPLPLPPAEQQPASSANQHAASAPTQHSSADMCGSLHLSGSPSSCVSHRPAWGGLRGADSRDFLHYGHYHGFGDTAEELSDSSQELRYRQAVGHLHPHS